MFPKARKHLFCTRTYTKCQANTFEMVFAERVDGVQSHLLCVLYTVMYLNGTGFLLWSDAEEVV
jgi:hypothetical protein